jgi:hypothetical protein
LAQNKIYAGKISGKSPPEISEKKL